MKIALPLAACLLAFAATAASAQSYWKWRDASGQIHIGDSAPPPGTPAKDILSRPNQGSTSVAAPVAAAAPDAASAPAGDSELQKKKAKADQEKADHVAAEKAAADQKNAAIRADNCSRAQAQVNAIQGGQRMARFSASGEREYLSDDERAAELRRTQDIVSQNCGPAPATP